MKSIEGKPREVHYLNQNADLPTFYTNNVDMLVTTWDMRFKFGHIETIEESATNVRNIATVYMSVEHARVFVDKARRLLEEWERMNAKTKEG